MVCLSTAVIASHGKVCNATVRNRSTSRLKQYPRQSYYYRDRLKNKDHNMHTYVNANHGSVLQANLFVSSWKLYIVIVKITSQTHCLFPTMTAITAAKGRRILSKRLRARRHMQQTLFQASLKNGLIINMMLSTPLRT